MTKPQQLGWLALYELAKERQRDELARLKTEHEEATLKSEKRNQND